MFQRESENMSPFENATVILLILILAVLLFMAWASYQAYQKIQNVSNELGNQLQNVQGLPQTVMDRLKNFINTLRA